MSNIAASRRTIGCLNQGVSLVEFVGCLAALGGGVVLGSIYLGVDVKGMAVEALEQADIEVPAILSSAVSKQQPTTDDSESGLAVNGDLIGDEVTEHAHDDGSEQNVALAEPQVAEHVQEPLPPLSAEEQRLATKACWQALSEAMSAESSNRSKSIRDSGNWQLFDYLLHRKNGHEIAVKAIEAIDLHGVEPRLQAHVAQVLSWQRSGASLFERATQLLTDAPAGKLSGPFAQSWQSASTQHRMEEKLVLNKHKAVAGYLEHTQKASNERP